MGALSTQALCHCFVFSSGCVLRRTQLSHWKQHITKIASTFSTNIAIINKLKYELPENTLLTIYNSLILPRIYKLQKKATNTILF